MKNLLIASIVIMSVNYANASCNLVLKSKTATTSGAKIGDVSFSKKQIEALSKQCEVKRTTFSSEELIALETIAYNKKIAKLKTTK